MYELDSAGKEWFDAVQADRQALLDLAVRFDAAMAAIQAPRTTFRQAVREALDTD
ncbi:hypothetical protein [Streptomyces tendae]|uniref:hypothetical protein n=1 Tax=Streptomyces tendae TaxID=1932 RepID=UPI00249235DD|nr:hypothetical protein [Streptomyces tendae]